MYKIIFVLVFAIASSLGLHAQEFQGMAIYESKKVHRLARCKVTRYYGNANMKE
jgi:hypothetical protein